MLTATSLHPATTRRGLRSAGVIGLLAVVAAAALDARPSPAQEWSIATNDRANWFWSRVLPVDDGSILLAFHVRAPDVNGNLTNGIAVRRIAADGATLWERQEDVPIGGRLECLLQAGPDRFLLGGTTWTTSLSAGVRCLDGDGNVLWSWGADDPALVQDMVMRPDGGTILTADDTFGPGASSAMVARIDATGAPQWYMTLERPSMNQGGSTIVASPSGNVVTYAVSEPLSLAKTHVFEIDDAGAIVWERELTNASSDVVTYGLEAAADGYVLFGTIYNGTSASLFVLEIDFAGNILWQRYYSGQTFYPHAMAVLDDGSLVLAGNVILVQGSPSGAFLYLTSTGAVVAAELIDVAMTGNGYHAAAIPGGGFLLSGSAIIAGAYRDFVIRALAPPVGRLGCIQTDPTTYTTRDPRIVSSVPAVATVTQFRTFTAQPQQVTFSPTTVPDACSPWCPPLSCSGASVQPVNACSGVSRTLDVAQAGGILPVTVEWDVDGDGVTDVTGAPVTAVVPDGVGFVTVTLTDSCSPPQQCSVDIPVGTLGAAMPEVSDPLGAAPSLRVDQRGARVTFERVSGATGFNVYADAIGSWYAPNTASGSACHAIAWTDNGDGTASLAPSLAPDSWILVTASSPCSEGSAGTDSFGTARTSIGTWMACGPLP